MLVAAVFGGTTFAAVRVMDTVPDVETFHAKRAQLEAAANRKDRKARKRAGRKSRGPLAGAPLAPDERTSRRGWATKADALCDRAHDETQALLDRSTAETPQDLLRLLDASLRIGARFIVRLERLGPAPNRQVHARLMRELEASQAADTRSVQALKASWSQGALDRAIQESMIRNESLRRLAERLDAVACSQLFDPLGFG